MSKPRVTAIVCHYNPSHMPFLQHLVCMCVGAQHRDNTEGLTTLICDGSPTVDPYLQEKFADDANIQYVHGGRQLSFGETYNLGVEQATSEFVVLIANDILIAGQQISRLVNELKGNVACVIPFLTESDYATQIKMPGRRPRRCFPSSMTINVNAFRRSELIAIGKVPTEMTGAFNDMVIFHRLRRQNKRIMLAHVGKVVHIGRMTRRAYSETQKYQTDLSHAAQLEPDLFSGTDVENQKNYWARLYANSAQMWGPKLMWRLLSYVPWQLKMQRGLGYKAASAEQYLACQLRNYVRALFSLKPT